MADEKQMAALRALDFAQSLKYWLGEFASGMICANYDDEVAVVPFDYDKENDPDELMTRLDGDYFRPDTMDDEGVSLYAAMRAVDETDILQRMEEGVSASSLARGFAAGLLEIDEKMPDCDRKMREYGKKILKSCNLGYNPDHNWGYVSLDIHPQPKLEPERKAKP